MSIQSARAVCTEVQVALLFICAGLSMGSDCRGYDQIFSGTPGPLGNLVFSIVGPMAAGGTRLRIVVDPLHASYVSVESADPAVLAIVSQDQGSVTVQTGVAGTADLRFFDGSGALVDRYPGVVKQPTALVLDDGAARLLFAGATAYECVKVMAGSEMLIATGALQSSLSGTLTATTVTSDLLSLCDSDHPDDSRVASVPFTGTPGQGDVVFSLGALTERRTWSILTESDIQGINLTYQYGWTKGGEPNIPVALFASASDQNGQLILGPKCDWSTSDNRLQLRPDDYLGGTRVGGYDLVEAKPPAAGTYSVTCTIGAALGTAQFAYPKP